MSVYNSCEFFMKRMMNNIKMNNIKMNNIKSRIIFLCYITLLLNFASCSSLFMSNDYDVLSDNKPDNFFQPDRDFFITSGDTGRNYDTPEQSLNRQLASMALEGDQKTTENQLTADQKEQLALAQEVKQLENTQPQMLYEHYLRYREYFHNDSERIYFLQISSLQEREHYLESKGFIKTEDYKYADDLNTKERTDQILQGMAPVQVRKLMRNPASIEVVDNQSGIAPRERWAYPQSTGRMRYIYFEQGRVIGWTEEVDR